MSGYAWSGPNPSIGWAGSLDWNEPRNWNFQNPALGPVSFPQNGDDAGFGFTPAGTISGTIAFQNCSAGSSSGSVEVKLSGVNCISGFLNASPSAEIDVVNGGGTLTANMQGGNTGSSGLLQGCVYNVESAILGGAPGSNLFQNFSAVVFKHTNPGGIAAIMGNVTGFSPLQVGQKNPPIGGDTGLNAQLDVFGGGNFTGGVTAEYPFGAVTQLPSLNLKSLNAAGAAGQPINLYGGAVTFTVATWSGHPLVLNPAFGQVNQSTALVADTTEFGIPLAIYLPDARAVGIKNSGADWRVYCTVDVNQFSGGFGNVNGFVGILDDVRVTTAAALTTLKAKGKHFYGKLSFDAGGKVIF